jgi:hypothetical protein
MIALTSLECKGENGRNPRLVGRGLSSLISFGLGTGLRGLIEWGAQISRWIGAGVGAQTGTETSG